ncbi:MAG: DNA-processing protein DprA [Clostridia bacterium]|nr:DNA-processing protein DprA [Clostridia bacterium]
MDHKDALFWIWLSEALGAASKSFRRLIELYGNAYDIFHAEVEELERIPYLSKRNISALSDKSLQHASEILDRCEKLGIGILPYGDEEYPVALKEIADPPVVLYYLGEWRNLNAELCIGMVGTRRMSAYGLRSAYKLSYELASVGAVIVSGMAKGIDGVCAAGALLAKGRTVAVLGSGVDIVYPAHHKPLSESIKREGVLISEYPPGEPPSRHHFPVRNRIISGLSQATVVVEAGIGSGSLITAKEAVLQGRDVFALPANVGSTGAEGTNGLLRDGAKLALSTLDILEPYRHIYTKPLFLERLPKAMERSEADLHALASLGVISLTRPQGTKESPVRAAPVQEPKKSRAKNSSSASEREQVMKSPKEEHGSAPVEQDAASKREKSTPDAVLSSLSEVQLAVLKAIPDDRAVSADLLNSLGYPYGETIAALTTLEIMGLVQKLPGALYTKA